MGKNKKKINSIVIASQNPGKIKEMLPFIKKLNTKIYFAKDFKLKEPKEDGSNFVENALKKSRYVNNKTKKVSIADDSGLVIPSLQGKPGVFSARYRKLSSLTFLRSFCKLSKLILRFSFFLIFDVLSKFLLDSVLCCLFFFNLSIINCNYD